MSVARVGSLYVTGRGPPVRCRSCFRNTVNRSRFDGVILNEKEDEDGYLEDIKGRDSTWGLGY